MPHSHAKSHVNVNEPAHYQMPRLIHARCGLWIVTCECLIHMWIQVWLRMSRPNTKCLHSFTRVVTSRWSLVIEWCCFYYFVRPCCIHMSHESCTIGHVTCKWVTHENELCVVSQITYEWVTSRMNESRRIWMSHHVLQCAAVGCRLQCVSVSCSVLHHCWLHAQMTSAL